jgi:sugar (pentulose or hexulose) kinase
VAGGGRMNTIAIFDIGKTNKKLFLFNEQYKIVWERSVQFAETVDEDGFACDDVHALSKWIRESLEEIISLPEFTIRAINFSAYGASFVHIDSEGRPVTPLYNYLKPYPEGLTEKFCKSYGDAISMSVVTASPVLGNLNSGMQLYRLKYEQEQQFSQIQYSLHLPQYISYLITGKPCSEITSIGCHTRLWNFAKNSYHDWVYTEQIDKKFPAIMASAETIPVVINDQKIRVGIGLHDSSSALIPYLSGFSEPFILLSTGTWCISLNPFNDSSLTPIELEQDCLCYLEYRGKPVKAARLFAGNEHEQQAKILATHFKVPVTYYGQVMFDPELFKKARGQKHTVTAGTGVHTSAFGGRDINVFASYEEAYHQLIYDIMQQQKVSTALVLSSKKVTRIFVDGGFAKNPVYMHMLAAAFPAMEVYAASVSQATAIGAALAIHKEWNSLPVRGDMVELKYYKISQ